MLLNCGVGEDCWESLGLQGDPTSPFWRRSVLGVHWKDWCWSWNFSTLATWWEELIHWKRAWYWERLRAGREGDNRGWDGWMASLTQWTRIWVNSRSWRWTGRPGLLHSTGLQTVGHDWATELNWVLTAVHGGVSLGVAHTLLFLQITGSRVLQLSTCSSQTSLPCCMWCLNSLTSNWTHITCIGKQIFNRRITREALILHFQGIFLTQIHKKRSNGSNDMDHILEALGLYSRMPSKGVTFSNNVHNYYFTSLALILPTFSSCIKKDCTKCTQPWWYWQPPLGPLHFRCCANICLKRSAGLDIRFPLPMLGTQGSGRSPDSCKSGQQVPEMQGQSLTPSLQSRVLPSLTLLVL